MDRGRAWLVLSGVLARPMTRSAVWIASLSLLLGACGEAAAPAPVPEEFDDPFAEEAMPAGVAEKPVVAEPATPTAAGAEAAEGPAAGEAAGGSAGEVVGPAAGEAAGEAAVEAAVVVGEASPKAGAVGATGEKAGAAGATGAKQLAKQAAPKGTPEPVPSDSPVTPTPEPTPAPAPVPEPTPTPAPVEKPAPPPVPPQQRFVGTFRFAGGEAQKQNLEAAIEAAASQLNALIRGIGRKRLKESNPVRDQISIAVDGDKVSMTFGPGRTVTGRLEGPSVPWTSDSGKPVQVSFSLVKGRLVQTFTAEDGGRRSVYSLDDTGDRLTLSVTVTSERLTNPLKYALTYRRN